MHLILHSLLISTLKASPNRSDSVKAFNRINRSRDTLSSAQTPNPVHSLTSRLVLALMNLLNQVHSLYLCCPDNISVKILKLHFSVPQVHEWTRCVPLSLSCLFVVSLFTQDLCAGPSTILGHPCIPCHCLIPDVLNLLFTLVPFLEFDSPLFSCIICLSFHVFVLFSNMCECLIHVSQTMVTFPSSS